MVVQGSREGCPPLAARPRFLASLPPPIPRPGCTSHNRQRLLARHLDPSAMAGACSTWDRFRCFHVAAAVLWEKPRRRLAHCLPLDHPKAVFLIDFDSGQRSTKGGCHPFIVEELMENGQGLSATWSANSDLPHRSRQGCNFSLTECQESPRDVFPQELFHLNGPNFLGVDVFLLIRDAVFWVSVVASCASVSERIHPSSSN